METSPCPPGTDHRAEQGWRLRIGKAVDVEAVVIAGHQHIAPKRHVGLREGEQGGTIAPFGAVIGLAVGGAAGLASSSFFLAWGAANLPTLVGSKKPVGLPSEATSVRWLAAWPASLKPAGKGPRGGP